MELETGTGMIENWRVGRRIESYKLCTRSKKP